MTEKVVGALAAWGSRVVRMLRQVACILRDAGLFGWATKVDALAEDGLGVIDGMDEVTPVATPIPKGLRTDKYKAVE